MKQELQQAIQTLRDNPRRGLTFEQACSRYVNRFTMTHVPSWAEFPLTYGKFYAPSYRNCREWYENTIFPEEMDKEMKKLMGKDCQSRNHSFPLGQFLEACYSNR